MMRDAPANDAPHRLIDDVAFGENVVIHSFANLYGCRIGDGTRIGTFVEIQRGAIVGVVGQAQVSDGIAHLAPRKQVAGTAHPVRDLVFAERQRH